MGYTPRFMFQFYLSSIKRKKLLLLQLSLRRFNSTLVQLKVFISCLLSVVSFSFQFYLSSIKSCKLNPLLTAI